MQPQRVTIGVTVVGAVCGFAVLCGVSGCAFLFDTDTLKSSAGEAGADAGDARQGLDDGRAPAVASQVGYTVSTFSSTMAAESVDVRDTQQSGYQWYLAQFFGAATTSASGMLTFNADGTLTIDNGGQIGTTAPSSAGEGWVGVAFGGGAYFEAVLSFDPEDVMKSGNGSPTWWAMSVEHQANLPGDQWAGQATNYVHNVLIDFFKYDVSKHSPLDYSGTIHEYYGFYGQCEPNVYCSVDNASGDTKFDNYIISTPSGTDFSVYHTYGFLWVPATSSQDGYVEHYFDGSPTTDKVTWSRFEAADVPPPGMTPWTFGVLDDQHLAVLLESGEGEPMRVRSVNVWQASTAKNLIQ